MILLNFPKRLTSSLALLGSLAAIAPTAAAADNYPNRSIKIIVPFGAGSATDMLSRSVAEGLSERLDEAVVVENRAGAAGAIGSSAVANAKPDGYTLIMATNGPFAANVSLYDDLPYSPKEDFEPVILMGKLPMILVTQPEAKASDFQDMIADAKANPDTVSFGASNTTAQVWAELIKKTQGLDVATVLYSQVGSLLTDLSAGRVSYAFENVGPSRSLLDSEKLKALAITSSERADFAPDVPTMEESDFNDYKLDVWFAMFAPKGTPDAIVEKINQEVNALLETDKLKNTAKQINMKPVGGTPQDLAKYHSAELDNWKNLIELTGVEIN